MDLWRCLNLSRLYHAHLLLLLNRYTIYLLSVMPPHQHRYGVLDISIFQSFPYCRCVQFIWFVRSFNGTNSSEILCDSLRYSANMLSSHIITKSNWDNGKNSISIELYCLGVRQSFKWKYLSLYPPCRCNLMRFKAAYNTIEIQKKLQTMRKNWLLVFWCWSIWNGSCAQAEHFFILRHSFWWCENFWFLFSWNFLFRRRSCHLFISFSKNCGNCHLVTIVASLWKCVRLFCKCLKHFHLIYWVAAWLVLSESRQLIKVHEQNELNYDFFRDFIIKMQFS